MPPLKTSENWIVSCGKEEPVSAAAERSEEGNGWEAGDELKVTTDLLARLLLWAHKYKILQTQSFTDSVV